MITRGEINEYAKTFGMKPWQLEKDYFQHILLHLIYSNTSSLVFKGGTAIKKAYGLRRFSEDLDFTQVGEIELDTFFEKISKELSEKFGYDNEVKKIKIKTELGTSYRFAINGPLLEPGGLGYCYIYIEISKRELPKTRDIIVIKPVFADLPDYSILVMSKEEILAEKVRAIIARDRVRDLYDLWYLLSQNVKIKTDWINEKMDYYKGKKKFSVEMFSKTLTKYKKDWNDMRQLTTYVPNFNEVIKLIREKFKTAHGAEK